MTLVLFFREMNSDELECHLQELESKNLNPRGVLRRLLQLCVREGKLDRALEVVRRCEELKVDISPGMLASIFDLYVQTKNEKRAAETLRKLGQNFPGFLLDEFKLVDYAALLVEKGNIDEARKVLRMRASVAEVKGGDNITKNVWNLLNNLASISPTLPPDVRNHTHDFFLFLNRLGFCDYSNSILGPVVKEFLNKNDIVGAVDLFKELTKSHRVTPLQRQLMTVLVGVLNQPEEQQKHKISQEKTQELLRDVISASTAVHGAANTNIALIVAIAEAGTDKQLRKMLIDPKVRISPDILRKQCEYLNAYKRLDALLKLARCSRGLGHIKEQDIYDMIMTTLVKENNYETALTIFEHLRSDDELKISADFVRNLVDLLKRNNLELPASVALYAK